MPLFGSSKKRTLKDRGKGRSSDHDKRSSRDYRKEHDEDSHNKSSKDSSEKHSKSSDKVRSKHAGQTTSGDSGKQARSDPNKKSTKTVKTSDQLDDDDLALHYELADAWQITSTSINVVAPLSARPRQPLSPSLRVTVTLPSWFMKQDTRTKSLVWPRYELLGLLGADNPAGHRVINGETMVPGVPVPMPPDWQGRLRSNVYAFSWPVQGEHCTRFSSKAVGKSWGLSVSIWDRGDLLGSATVEDIAVAADDDDQKGEKGDESDE